MFNISNWVPDNNHPVHLFEPVEQVPFPPQLELFGETRTPSGRTLSELLNEIDSEQASYPVSVSLLGVLEGFHRPENHGKTFSELLEEAHRVAELRGGQLSLF